MHWCYKYISQAVVKEKSKRSSPQMKRTRSTDETQSTDETFTFHKRNMYRPQMKHLQSTDISAQSTDISVQSTDETFTVHEWNIYIPHKKHVQFTDKKRTGYRWNMYSLQIKIYSPQMKHLQPMDETCNSQIKMYKVVQIWPGRFVCKQSQFVPVIFEPPCI